MKSFHARLLKRELTLKNSDSAKDTDVENDKTFFCKEEYWQWRSQLEKDPHTRIIKGKITHHIVELKKKTTYHGYGEIGH